MKAVRCEQVVKQFKDVRALKSMTMEIEEGEIYGLIGRNGAGKTTILRIIAGTAFPTEGTVEIFEKPQSDVKRIGCFIDGLGLYPNLSGKKNMLLFADLMGSNAKEVHRLLELVGLGDAMNRKVSGYSLGMKQRLGLAIALLGNPSLIVLDEPFNGLDPLGVRLMSDLIVKLNKEEGKTFIISSHMLGELSKIATHYGFIDQGELKDEFPRESKQASELEEYFLEKVGYEYA